MSKFSFPSIIFLGGTCGNNVWRPGLIEAVTRAVHPSDLDGVTLFDPVVKDWNEAAQAREEEMKAKADIHVYFIASPKLDSPTDVSAYSLVEATMALYDRPDHTLVAFDNTGIEGHSLKAMKQAAKVLATRFPGKVLASYESLVDTLAHRLRTGT